MATINYLTRIEFNEGAISTLPALLAELGVKKPLIATDKGLVSTGLVAKVLGLFDETPAVFDGTPANPTEEAVTQAYDLYKSAGCDGIVGLGGGSSLDLAKAVRLLTGHAAPLAQYTAVEGGASKIHGRICPMIAVPTTSGTGSEVGRAAVIITREGRKLGILSGHMLPSIALCDPELTYGLPPFLTAATGMDALSHCLETYMGPSVNPPADAIALDGLKRGFPAIRKAVANGSDRQARWDMMMAAMEGAMAFQKGLGAVHALTHPLGAIRDLNLHHGTLNAVLMPAVLRFNRSVIGAKWDVMADIMGGAPDEITASLNHDIGMPSGLKAMGVTDAMMEKIAGEALKDHCHATNPRLASREDYLALLQESA
ncbi:iron-containing alcohol dehydrogenase [Agrobacterium vitis]|uniref:Iron-containing alcohol dehydrogenase n=1 Tax=Agrobacterium vitis TaxID=373 RepID=A0A368P0A2_AGRVI|nr:iron-containing alcohol dehydrogenase [Agrobacterium vitis]KAA3511308.1 iron-containing alcohol dehydrogenase [Agrobacterium vitis]KAA3527870.1 iron-containing alcohol dehydrogenase [Agrobacterium vitis]MCF1478408.1 iron-containing alcohol dehydrogenase [Agrobacterium vitis]MUZ96569.1 iron-containing alcohol dehydrogenase [Agrobacterium vitis]MVA28578.1 iron-containing alcohol dehydrogenase [Agrobacterium vitis]